MLVFVVLRQVLESIVSCHVPEETVPLDLVVPVGLAIPLGLVAVKVGITTVPPGAKGVAVAVDAHQIVEINFIDSVVLCIGQVQLVSQGPPATNSSRSIKTVFFDFMIISITVIRLVVPIKGWAREKSKGHTSRCSLYP